MRHAQEYWLKRQAEAALDLAMAESLPSAKVLNDIIDLRESAPPGTDMATMRTHRELAIREAADALAKAELLQREMERMKARG